MRVIHTSLCLAVAGLNLLFGPQAHAQAPAQDMPSCERTRAEVRKECAEFLRTHRWDEVAGQYLPRDPKKARANMSPPEGVKSRAEVRAERDSFLKANRWNDNKGQWEPISGTPREISQMSRAEVRKETRAFMRTHRWDEATQSYVEQPVKAK